MHILKMMLVLTAFDTKCTAVAFQPCPQRTTRMTTLRSARDSDDTRVRLAVLETKMNSMGKTLGRIELSGKNQLQRIELSGKTKLKDVKTGVEEDIGSLKTDLEAVQTEVKKDIGSFKEVRTELKIVED
jgi:hypothetical protein